jgi:DNA-binding transcriptional MerR regulator
MEPDAGHLRIGELSQRTGVSPELLRAWERRYGLLKPSRSPGGFRLYSEADEARIRRMRSHLARGVAAAEAARLAESVVVVPSTGSGSLPLLEERLRERLDAFDESGAQLVLDEALASFTIDTLVSDLLVPYLRDLGDRWERGEVTVAQEHFASNLIRTRVLSLARSWDAGSGPRALLACPEGDLHDLGLALFGVVLARRGWRVTFLGANTPLPTVNDTAERVAPDLIALAVSDPTIARANGAGLADLATRYRVVVGGSASGEIDIEGLDSLDLDPVQAAQYVTERPSG